MCHLLFSNVEVDRDNMCVFGLKIHADKKALAGQEQAVRSIVSRKCLQLDLLEFTCMCLFRQGVQKAHELLEVADASESPDPIQLLVLFRLALGLLDAFSEPANNQ